MTAQHRPRYPVRPSSGFKNWLKRRWIIRFVFVWLYCKNIDASTFCGTNSMLSFLSSVLL